MRFDRLDIATSDLTDAVETYAKNFGFAVERKSADTATIDVGDSQIQLQAGPQVAGLISSNGEGLAAIWLETDDVEPIAEALRAGGAGVSEIRIQADRRIVAIEPKASNLVPLYIFDRRTS